MTVPEPLPRSIAEQAADWILRREAGFSPQESESFELWRLADARHEEALSRLGDLWRELDEVKVPVCVPSPVPPVRRAVPPPRWTWALAASLALVWLASGTQWLARLGADYSTEVGEQRTLHLDDGSMVTLDSNTALDLDFTADRRSLRLLAGRALFIVHPDPKRPFVVEAGQGQATALGTRFTVATDDDGSDVIVTEHSVAVRLNETRPTVLTEGRAMRWNQRGAEKVRRVDIPASMAWTDGQLVASGAPLRDVVAEIGRYRRGYVGLMGEAGSIRVSGVYDLTRPDDAIEALRESLGLREIRLTDRLIVLRR